MPLDIWNNRRWTAVTAMECIHCSQPYVLQMGCLTEFGVLIRDLMLHGY